MQKIKKQIDTRQRIKESLLYVQYSCKFQHECMSCTKCYDLKDDIDYILNENDRLQVVLSKYKKLIAKLKNSLLFTSKWPCKLNDTVYELVLGFETKNDYIIPDLDNYQPSEFNASLSVPITKMIDKYKYNIDDCSKHILSDVFTKKVFVIRRKFSYEMINKIGITIFLDADEAIKKANSCIIKDGIVYSAISISTVV